MEKAIITSIKIIAFVVLILVITSSNLIYNQKINTKKSDQIIETIKNKSFAVRCVPSTITINQKEETVVTSIDCDKGSAFVNSGYDSGIHFITGEYDSLSGSDAKPPRQLAQ